MLNPLYILHIHMSLWDMCIANSFSQPMVCFFTFLIIFFHHTFLKVYFELENNCFVMLCWFLMNKTGIKHKYTYIPFLLSLPSPHWAEFPVLFSSFPLSMHLHMAVYICHCYSPHSSHLPHPWPSPPLCPRVHSLHLHLYSCLVNRFICTLFLDSICIQQVFGNDCTMKECPHLCPPFV